MLFRILFSCITAFAQVQQAELKSVSNITPFLIQNGCAERVTLMMFIPGERATDCYGLLLEGVKVTGQALGNVVLFPAAHDLQNAEEIAGEILQVLKRKKTAGWDVQISPLRFVPQALAVKDLSGDPTDPRSYLFGGLSLISVRTSDQGGWQQTLTDRRRIGVN